jgi:hypothetical protein
VKWLDFHSKSSKNEPLLTRGKNPIVSDKNSCRRYCKNGRLATEFIDRSETKTDQELVKGSAKKKIAVGMMSRAGHGDFLYSGV